MKMIPAGTSAANQYRSFAHNCLRNAACEQPYTAPLPSVSAMQLYVDFGTVQPITMEFTFIDTCNNTTEQIFPAQYTVGQTPEGGWYGVFREFTDPGASFTAFVIHLSINGGSNTYFSEMLSTEPCGPLMKIKSCHPEGATTTGFDVNGVYYGLPQGSFLGTGIRYWHIAYVRYGKLRELSDKATFKSNLYSNFRTTVEKLHLIQTELVPKWYKNVLLAIYSRGAVSIDDGQNYLVSDLAFEALNDDDLTWKPYAQVKETFRLFYGCDDARCEECCNPTLISVQINDGPPVSNSSQGPSEPPQTGCLRVIFQISGSGPWAIGGLMCDGHPMAMEGVVGDGLAPLPLCVQFDSLTGIEGPVSIIFTEPCPNDCVIYRNPSATENTTGITYRDCAGVWHEDIMLLPGEEICARRSWVIGPTTGVQGPGSGTLVEVGFCGSFPDESEAASSSGSGGGSEPPAAECCDPILTDATTETTIPDGSLPGGDSGSESVTPVCCTPFILSATIETIDDESGSGSDSGVDQIEVFLDGVHTTATEDLTDQAGVISALPLLNVTDFSFQMDLSEVDYMVSVVLLKLGGIDSATDYLIGGTAGSPIWSGEVDMGTHWRVYIVNSVSGYLSGGTITITSNPITPLRLIYMTDQSANSLSDWNTLFDTATNADTPFDDVQYSPDGLTVDLFGHTNLTIINVFETNLEILKVLDFSSQVVSLSGTFAGAESLTEVRFPGCLTFQANSFLNATLLTDVYAPLVINANSLCFYACVNLISILLPACTTIDNSCFAFCSVIQNIDLPVCTSIQNGFNFRGIGDGVNPITINTPMAAPYGGTSGDDSVFLDTTGQTITITLPSSETGDGDITTVSGANSVTLIPV